MKQATPESEKIIEIYRKHAEAWVSARRAQPFFEMAWLDRFCAQLPEGRTILDIGCGCGEPVAGYLLGRGYSLSGVDSSPEMIAMCRAKYPNASWCVADMRTLDMWHGYDGLLAWDSFFHLGHDDQRRMFEIFRKHAAPGAALMFTSGTAHGEALGSLQGDPLYHASLDAGEYRALLSANGFAVVANTAEDESCGGRTVWLAKSAI